MHAPTNLKWLFMDLNSYFASVEQQENPSLRGKPVAVVPMPTDSTCAIAASYEAKAYGIKTGTKIYEAKRMCPDLRCVLARHDVYVDYHHRILEEVIKHTPINKVCSIDELSSRLPPNRRSEERAVEVAHRLKDGLRQNIGEAITCSIGLAPNSLLGKIASDMQKPDGLTILHPDNLPGPLLDLRLTDLPGIGENMERRLNRAGIQTIEQFWNISPKHARKIWGSVQGERFWYWLHGYDFEAPETGNVMIGHSRVLDLEHRTPDKARLMARRLLTKASYRLRRKGFYATRLSLGARSTEGWLWKDEISFSAAQDPFTFLHMLDQMWGAMMAYTPDNRHFRFKKISTILHGLKTQKDITDDIFTANPGWQDALKKREALTNALDTLQSKYHKEAVCVGVAPKTLAGHVGTKIAFSRVPDQEEFWH